MADLENIISDKEFSATLKKKVKLDLFWVLLVDDYLTIRTHVLGQSTYNLFSAKLASITVFMKNSGYILIVKGIL
ncbi:14924_t:CDS:2 [Funneliformis geosporum]|uniref:10998_t:CDS:1 n=1 Tax=Funneliformis geosporum TaxID=1117311 RepID=A0A9W4T4C5_9GLOM|nr:10998_t:CDS:2 [Funneliformis geosporum]CAI2192865.1 14924_t:CDS:2 [Funneliformis geosporum]